MARPWLTVESRSAARFRQGLIRGFRLKLRPGVVFVVFLGSAEDEGGPLDSLVKEANRLGATCYGTTSNVGAEPQGAKHHGRRSPR
jgi:hypothetical protein